jgi:hypothetical protein
MQRLATHARRSGLRQLYGDVLAGNAPMLALVRRLGGRIVFHPDDDALLRTCFAL